MTTYIKRGYVNNPRWKEPATQEHKPCGYWYNNRTLYDSYEKVSITEGFDWEIVASGFSIPPGGEDDPPGGEDDPPGGGSAQYDDIVVVWERRDTYLGEWKAYRFKLEDGSWKKSDVTALQVGVGTGEQFEGVRWSRDRELYLAFKRTTGWDRWLELWNEQGERVEQKYIGEDVQVGKSEYIVDSEGHERFGVSGPWDYRHIFDNNLQKVDEFLIPNPNHARLDRDGTIKEFEGPEWFWEPTHHAVFDVFGFTTCGRILGRYVEGMEKTMTLTTGEWYWGGQGVGYYWREWSYVARWWEYSANEIRLYETDSQNYAVVCQLPIPKVAMVCKYAVPGEEHPEWWIESTTVMKDAPAGGTGAGLIVAEEVSDYVFVLNNGTITFPGGYNYRGHWSDGLGEWIITTPSSLKVYRKSGQFVSEIPREWDLTLDEGGWWSVSGGLRWGRIKK